MRQTIWAITMIMACVTSAGADGIIIPRPAPWMPSNAAVNIKYHNVDVTINDPVALTRVDQVFVNPYQHEMEADYIFPIPENAVISRFVAWLGGKKMEAELLDASQARRIYEDIVRRRKDPALLEYAGNGMYRLRIYPIPARGDVRIQIEYEQTLRSDNGTVEYVYPLNTEKFSGANLEQCKVEVRANSFANIGALYCPTHPVKTERIDAKSMRAIYRDENVRPSKNIAFYFTRQESNFGFHLLSYREPGRDNGFFLGILAPPIDRHSGMTNKNIVFVLDSSGSMRGEKFHQAIDALKFCLDDLDAGDNFNIIDYDDAVRPFRDGLVAAKENNIAEARVFAEKIEASGGTDIYNALSKACGMIRSGDNPSYIIFLTDGQPTVGNTDLEQIIKNTADLNENRARLFVFGVGYDVNTSLLDRLAEQNHGIPEYVLPNENIEAKISRLTSKISHPALTGLALSFGNEHTSDIYPAPLPDLFYGSEIIITGHFENNGPATAVISGKLRGENISYDFPVVFSDGSGSDDFIALLWANRRIGYLLQELRLRGSNNELLTEIISLSKKYGIITEYTSFLVTGDERTRRQLIAYESKEIASDKKSELATYMAPQTGRSAVGQSRGLQKQASADQLSLPGVGNIAGEEENFTNMTQVGSQGFFKVGTNWIQGDLTGDKSDMQIKQYSQAYFQLLDNDPALGRYLGLGNEVRLKIGTQVVQIAENGKEVLGTEELRALFPGK